LANDWLPVDADLDDSEVVNRTLDYILKHLGDELSLGTAARMIGMSESSFSRHFKRASGYNFTDLARKLRIAQACKLLDSTSDSVASVAYSVGYRNLSNFNRQFLLETGATPRQWRGRPDRTTSGGGPSL
jgi:AraC-like DNA-binding protein